MFLIYLGFTRFNIGVKCQSVLYRASARLKNQRKRAKNEKCSFAFSSLVFVTLLWTKLLSIP